MARPPSEWPIPIYELELRERLIACFTVPPPALLRQVPAPLTPQIIHGRGLCAVTMASGRVLKRSGIDQGLASEFRLLEVQVPVIWQRPCVGGERGLFTLLATTDHTGLHRLLKRCAQATAAVPVPQAHARPRKVQLADPYEWWAGAETVRIKTTPAEWPTNSLIDGPERAEALLAHPTHRFFRDAEGDAVRAVPVRDYSRSTTPVAGHAAPVDRVAALLGVDPEELALDHLLLQKRVTQTVFFPSERISTLARSGRNATGLRSSDARFTPIRAQAEALLQSQR